MEEAEGAGRAGRPVTSGCRYGLAELPRKGCNPESVAQVGLEVMSRLGLLQQPPLGQGQQTEACPRGAPPKEKEGSESLAVEGGRKDRKGSAWMGGCQGLYCRCIAVAEWLSR